MKNIKSFKQLSNKDTKTAGGKGASLGEMINAKVPVPPGFVVLASAFDKFMRDTDAVVEENAMLDRVDISSTENVEEGIKEKPVFNGQQIISQKEKILKKFSLSEKEKFLIHTIEKCFHWQDERKKFILQSISELEPVVHKIAQRFSIDKTDLKFATPEEVNEKNFLSSNFKEQLKKRREKSVYYSVPQKNYIFTNSDYDFFSEGLHVALEDNGDDLKGTVASPGVVQGIVKVCESVSDIDKVQEGEILVASMTRPEYLPAMQKAAAFITEEGGITCHAAIVAREMKKPCIIGTKTATKLLKDGDLVEVDANKGIVRIIKK